MTKYVGSVDEFYTPPDLAQVLASQLPSDSRGVVLDPTVGSGALLEAVEARFGSAVSLLGTDISRQAISTLRKKKPEWILSSADFLSPRSRGSSAAWKAATRADLAAVVLNPPFSFRGNSGKWIQYGSFAGRVSPAMHFLVETVKNLDPRLGIFGVLPEGALLADRHQELWSEIEENFCVTITQRFSSSSFKGVRASTSLVVLTPGGGGPSMRSDVPANAGVVVTGCRCVEVIRGRVPVHVAMGEPAKDEVSFLHSTNMSSTTTVFTADRAKADDGPFLLIVRVGAWKEPVTIEVGRAVLSDCVIALRPRAKEQLRNLKESVSVASDNFRSEYKGTGAKYLTLGSIETLLTRLGWRPFVTKAGAPVAECSCGVQVPIDEMGQVSNV